MTAVSIEAREKNNLNKQKTINIKRTSYIIILCLISSLVMISCGKRNEPLFLKLSTDIQGGYDLQELDLAELGIGAPGGICIYNESIYVCDVSNNCIVKLGKEFVKEDSFGTLGMEEGNFSEPRDITFSDGCFYVLDSKNNRVQKFTSDFQYLEMYYLHPLYAQQGLGRYVSIAVDAEGIIYVSAISSNVMDAYIFAYKNGEWEKIGDEVVGYLCAGEKGMYFANIFEFEIKEKTMAIQSGKNTLYEVVESKLVPMARIEDKYAPAALRYWDGGIYLVSIGTGAVNRFSRQDEVFETLFVLPSTELYMYMDIDIEGSIYISDSENRRLYFAEKRE